MSYLDLVPVPPKSTFNVKLSPANNRFMLDLLGHSVAHGRYRPDGQCTEPTATSFVSLLVTRRISPTIRVRGLRPAVDSLEQVLHRVQNELPDLFSMLGTAGMQCSRFTKILKPDGKMKIGPSISNHSWGTAIDLTLNGSLDQMGDGRTYKGLLVLSCYFNAAGWYWGASFPREDAMHFEASKTLLAQWKKDGLIR